MDSFASIFSECQRSIATHKKCIKAAITLVCNNKKAIKEFFACVDRILVVDKRHPAVERCVSFIANFIGQYSANLENTTKPALWAPLLSHLLERSNVKNASIRFRSCQIIAEMLSVMPEDLDIDDDLWDGLSEKMVLRTKDKAAITRGYAARALARLQDPSDSADPLPYVRLLSTDPTKEVRKVVLAQLGISKKTLPYILQRSRDTSDEIRRDTYTLLGKKVDIRALTIAQRIDLLEGGLQDRSDEVRKAVVAMTAAWQNMDTEGGIIVLLRCLDIENEGEQAGSLVVKELHKAGLLQLPEPDFSSLTAESALLWRVICETWKEQKDAALETLPELSQICKFIMQHQSESNNFIVKQLIALSKHLDLADEVGRRNLNALICQMLCDLSTPLEYVTPLLDLLYVFHSSSGFTSLALEIISELRYPLYEKSAAQKEAGEISEGDEESDEEVPQDNSANKVEEALRTQTQERIKEISKHLALLKTRNSQKKRSNEDRINDADQRSTLEEELVKLEELLAHLNDKINQQEEKECKIWCQSLDIVLFLLQNTNQMKEHSGVMEIHSVMLVKALSHPLPIVRARGVCCTVLYCLLDFHAACSHISVFLELLNRDVPPIQLTILKGLFDLIAFFGLPLLQETFAYKDEKLSLVSVIAPYLSHEDDDFRGIAVEGFAKLFMADIITDPQHFTSLVLYFFNPTTADDLELRQCLSVFFPAFAFCNFKAHSTVIESAYVSTLKTILHAPSSSSLKKVPLLQVAQMLLALLDSTYIRASTDNSTSPPAFNQMKIAVQLAHEILANPKDNKDMSKVLNHLTVCEDDQELVKTMVFLVEEIMEESVIKREKLAQKAMAKFLATLKRADKNPEAHLTSSKVEELREKTKQLSETLSNAKEAVEAKPRQKRQPVKKSRVYVSDSESSEEESVEEESEEEVVVVKTPARAPSTRRANIIAKSKMQALSSSSEEEDEDEDEEDEGGEEEESDADCATQAPVSPPTHTAEQHEDSEEDGSEKDSKHDVPTARTASSKNGNTSKPSHTGVDNKSSDTESESDDENYTSESEGESESDHITGKPAPISTKTPSKESKSTNSQEKSTTSNYTSSASNIPQVSVTPAESEDVTSTLFSRVRQVSVYDSEEELSDSTAEEEDVEEEEDEDDEEYLSTMDDKENIPNNIMQPNQFVEASPYQPPQKPRILESTVKKMKEKKAQELNEEIGQLLDGDLHENLIQQTVLAVKKQLLGDMPTPQPPRPSLLKPINTIKTKINSVPVRLHKGSSPPTAAAAKLKTKPSVPTARTSTLPKTFINKSPTAPVPLAVRPTSTSTTSPPTSFSSSSSSRRSTSTASPPISSKPSAVGKSSILSKAPSKVPLRPSIVQASKTARTKVGL